MSNSRKNSRKRRPDDGGKFSLYANRNRRTGEVSFNLVKARSNAEDTPTSVLFTGKITGDVDIERFNKLLEKHIQSADTHVHIEEVLETSQAGSPIKAKARNKKGEEIILERIMKIGEVTPQDKGVIEEESLALHVFSISKPNEEPSESISLENIPEDSPIYEYLKAKKIDLPAGTTKMVQEALIDEDRLKKTRMLKNRDPEKLVTKSFMTLSADKYFDLAGLKSLVSLENCHLIAASIIDELKRNPQNIFIGSKHTNTIMIYVEEAIAYLAKNWKKPFTLRVEIDVHENTHIGKTVKMTIDASPHFKQDLIFSAQEKEPPRIDVRNYIKAIFKAHVEARSDIKLSPIKNNPHFKKRRIDSDESVDKENIDPNSKKRKTANDDENADKENIKPTNSNLPNSKEEIINKIEKEQAKGTTLQVSSTASSSVRRKLF